MYTKRRRNIIALLLRASMLDRGKGMDSLGRIIGDGIWGLDMAWAVWSEYWREWVDTFSFGCVYGWLWVIWLWFPLHSDYYFVSVAVLERIKGFTRLFPVTPREDFQLLSRYCIKVDIRGNRIISLVSTWFSLFSSLQPLMLPMGQLDRRWLSCSQGIPFPYMNVEELNEWKKKKFEVGSVQSSSSVFQRGVSEIVLSWRGLTGYSRRQPRNVLPSVHLIARLKPLNRPLERIGPSKA